MTQRNTATGTAWLKDPAFDLTLIVGVMVLAFAMSGATVLSPALFLPILTAHIWLLSYDHVFSTFTKLAGLPEDRRRNRFLIFYLPPIVFAAVFTVGNRFGAAGLYTIYFFWQFVHTVRQSWGLAQQYRHRAGGLAWDDNRLAEITLWSVPVWGLLSRCHQHPTEFLWQSIWMPRVPLLLVQVAGVVAVALLVLWTAMRVRAYYRGELSLPHTLFLLTHFVVFYASYIWIDDVNSGWLLVNVWHNTQYLAFVWMHNRQRFSTGIHEEAKTLSWFCQPGVTRAAAYFLVLLVVAGSFYGALLQTGYRLDALLQGRVASLVLVGSLTLNFHHYLVDSFIWKRRRAAPSVRPA